MTFLKSLPKFFFSLNVAFTIGFVIGLLTGDGYLYSTYDGFVFQGVFAFGWALSWLPAGFWKAFFEVLPYILIWNILSDS